MGRWKVPEIDLTGAEDAADTGAQGSPGQPTPASVAWFWERVFSGSRHEESSSRARVERVIRSSLDTDFVHANQPMTADDLIAWRRIMLDQHEEVKTTVTGSLSTEIHPAAGIDSAVAITFVSRASHVDGSTWELTGMVQLGFRGTRAVTSASAADLDRGWIKRKPRLDNQS